MKQILLDFNQAVGLGQAFKLGDDLGFFACCFKEQRYEISESEKKNPQSPFAVSHKSLSLRLNFQTKEKKLNH